MPTLILLSLTLLVGCKNHDDQANTDTASDGAIAIRGVVPAARRDADEPVDQIIALSHVAGRSNPDDPTIVTLAEDGSFEVPLDPAYDTVLFLVDSTQTDPRQRVKGAVTLQLDDGSLMNLPGGSITGTIEAGELIADGFEATSQTSTDDVSAFFGVGGDTLQAMGLADDMFMHFVNVVANLDTENNVFWETDVQYTFREDLREAEAGATPPYLFTGLRLAMQTNHSSAIDPAAFGAGNQTIVLVPPAEFTVGTDTYGPTAPIPVPSVSAEPSATYPDMVQVSTWLGQAGPSGLYDPDAIPRSIESLPEGWWALRVDDVDIAYFDFSITLPYDANGLPVGLYPVPSIDQDGAHVISEVAIDWRIRDVASDTDGSALPEDLALVSNGAWIELQGAVGTSQWGATPIEEYTTTDQGQALPTQAETTQTWHTTELLPDGVDGKLILEYVSAGTVIGPVTTTWEWVNTCVDGDGDSYDDCSEGTAADAEPTIYPSAPELCGDGLDNDGAGGDTTCSYAVQWLSPPELPFVADSLTSPDGQYVGVAVTLEDASLAGQETWVHLADWADYHGVCATAAGMWDDRSRSVGPLQLHETAEVWFWVELGETDCANDWSSPQPGHHGFASIRINQTDQWSPDGDLHRRDFDVTDGQADVANVVDTVTFPTVPAAAAGDGVMQVTGTATTSAGGMLLFSPFSEHRSHWSGLTLLDVSVELYEAGTNTLFSSVCLEPSCASTQQGSVSGQSMVWVPAGGTVDYVVSYDLRWDVADPALRASPLAWGHDATGTPRHTTLDGPWLALPMVPVVGQ